MADGKRKYTLLRFERSTDVIETSPCKSMQGQRHSRPARPERNIKSLALAHPSGNAILFDLTAARYHLAASLRSFLQPRPFA